MHTNDLQEVFYWSYPKKSVYGFHVHSQVFYNLMEPVDEKEEECTKRIKVSQDMTPQDVLTRVLEDERSSLGE